MSVLVDTHVHILSGDSVRYTRVGPAGAPWTKRAFERDALASEMNAAGVASAVIVQALGVYAFDNSYVIDAVAGQHAAFAGVIALDPTDPASPDAIRRIVRGRVRGVRLPAAPGGRGYDAAWLRDERADRLWQAAVATGASIVMWCGAEALPDVAALARRYPNVDVALDHCGGASLVDNDAPQLAPFSDMPHVHVKVTTAQLGAPGVEPAALVQNLVARFSASRLLWGTNYPASDGTYLEMAELARHAAAGLSAAARDAFLSGTARGLYF